MTLSPNFQHLRLPIATALLATLGACGGGDGLDLPCGGTQDLSLAITYEVNGVLVDGSRTIVLPRGVPVLATPRILGLPAACNGATLLTVRSSNTGSPNGMSLDANTGVVSGTATSLGRFNINFKVAVDGYPNELFQTINFIM